MKNKIRISTHNGRTNKSGKAYNPNHNDRQTRRDNLDKHINETLSNLNFSCNYYNDNSMTFLECEKKFYAERYGDTLNERAKRYKAHGVSDRIQSIDEYRTNPKTCPEERILQIGNVDDFNHVCELLNSKSEARKIYAWLLKNALHNFLNALLPFSNNYHSLNSAIHLDEATPHIHERHIMDYVKPNEEIVVSQNTALKNMGFELPNPEQKESRRNNRKITFDKYIRDTWIQNVKDSLLLYLEVHPENKEVIDYLANINETPIANQKTLDKYDYVIKKQNAIIQKNIRKMDYINEFNDFVNEMEIELKHNHKKSI